MQKLTTLANRNILYSISTQESLLDDILNKGEYKIKDSPIEESPQEKILKYGPEALLTVELMAIILGEGSKKTGVSGVVKSLIKEYGEQAIMRERDPRKLESALDLSSIKACQLVACFELGRRFSKTPSNRFVSVRTAKQVYDYLSDMRDLSKEHLRGLYLDAHYHVVHDEVISIGSVSANLVHPREVFRPALQHSASAVILAHNHPSGVVTPSTADLAVTKQLVEAGKIMGVALLDHLVVTKTKFASIPAEY